MLSFRYEKRLWEKGYKFIAGVDEVGRGPLAGPVLAAAVVFPPDVKIKDLADSKKLTPKKREELFCEIEKRAVGIGIGKVSHKLIDKLKIGRANLLAMKKAIEKLSFSPDYLLIDGERYQIDLPIKQRGISGGDGKCASIAAASIIAKVIRDRIMLRYHQKFPEYRFDRHKGYGTHDHMRKIYRLGPSPLHRRSFYPVSKLIEI